MLGHKALTCRQHRKVTCPPPRVQRVIVLRVFVTQTQERVGVTESLRDIEGKNISRLVDISISRRNVPRRKWYASEKSIAPGGGILLALTECVRVTQGDFGKLRHA